MCDVWAETRTLNSYLRRIHGRPADIAVNSAEISDSTKVQIQRRIIGDNGEAYQV
jgi:hypothetical protein